MKKISLIIPVYNAEKYLPALAESLFAQTYENFQVIFSDDGSTDGSVGILTRLAAVDSRVTVILEQNAGVSAARNRALQKADGDYIGFADGDDVLEPAYLSTLAALLEAHNADVSCCGFSRTYESSGFQDRMPPRDGPPEETDRDGFFRRLLQPDGYTTVVWNKLFRREVLLGENGAFLPFDESLHIVEDGEFLFRTGVEKAVFTPQPLYRYVVRDSGAMYGALSDRKKTELTARKRIVELSRDSSPEVQALAKMKYQKGLRDLMFHAVLSGQGKDVRALLPELKTYRRELFESPALSKKEKLKYRVYRPIIQWDLRRLGAFLMKTLSGHG